MKLIFMGTPALAVPFLQRLHCEHEIALVVTQPDRAVGRSKEPQPSPVKRYALENNLPVAQPNKAREESFVAQIQNAKADAIAVVAFGQILPKAILDAPRLACLNAHFSMLPRWRGAAPVQWSLLSGDATTGVTIQHMTEKLDAGDVVLAEETPIEAGETTADLWERLTPIGARLLAEALAHIENGSATRTPQDESAVTIARQLRKSDGAIQWNASARHIENQLRGTHPWPGAFCTFREKTLKIIRAHAAEYSGKAAPGSIVQDGARVLVATGEGALELHEVQSEGRPKMNIADWLRGTRLTFDELLHDGVMTESAS